MLISKNLALEYVKLPLLSTTSEGSILFEEPELDRNKKGSNPKRIIDVKASMREVAIKGFLKTIP